MADCSQCGALLPTDRVQICGDVFGDEYIESYYHCPACGAYTLTIYRDRFMGEPSSLIRRPLTAAEALPRIQLIKRSPTPQNEHCDCPAHQDRASVGPEPGTTYRGRHAVRAGFVAILGYDDATGVRASMPVFVGNRAYAEWEYDVPGKGGGPAVVRGIDVFELIDGRISLKDAFRKTYPIFASSGCRRANGSQTRDGNGMTGVVEQFTPCRTRSIRFRGLHTEPDITLKIYGISATEAAPAANVVSAAVDLAVGYSRAPLDPAVAAGINWSGMPHHGLGIVIVHVGREAVFALFDRWVGENMLRHHVWATTKERPTAFESLDGSDMSACVWEMAVLQHERTAWLRHMLTTEGRPDRAGYLADVLDADL